VLKYLLPALLLIGFPAAAQAPNCAPTTLLYVDLLYGFGESRQTLGAAADGYVVETWANLASGTWTIIATSPDGVSCMVASGEAFTIAPPGEPA
jgi:hypothetical protein